MDVVLGVVLGVVLSVSVAAALRLARAPRRVLSPEGEAMREAVHAATATLPHLRRGLSRETARPAAPHLRALTQAAAVVVCDLTSVLAHFGEGGAAVRPGSPVEYLLPGVDLTRTRVTTTLPPAVTESGLRAAVSAPLVVQDRVVGRLVALYPDARRVRPEDSRVVGEAASLVSAQIALAELSTQGERLARAELRALRAQISPHFVYNALAAVASYIHTQPDEARELLTEFAEFIRYAFRGELPYVTLSEELHYVEKYLRLEQARFGERLQVRVSVAPEVLPVVVPTFSVQPLVENAVRHGVERAEGRSTIEILGNDLGADVEVVVRDDGQGMDEARAAAALAGSAGGIGLANVHGRLQSTFGDDYGLEIESRMGHGTTIRMHVPKFRAGVRAA